MTQQIKYNIMNQVNEQTNIEILNYIRLIQDFAAAKDKIGALEQKYIEKGYSKDEITTWIECTITLNSSGEVYEYSTYAYAKTPHSKDYEYVSMNSTSRQYMISKEYSKDRNTLGQRIIDAFTEEAKAAQRKKDELNEILAGVVEKGYFFLNDIEYQVIKATTN